TRSSDPSSRSSSATSSSPRSSISCETPVRHREVRGDRRGILMSTPERRPTRTPGEVILAVEDLRVVFGDREVLRGVNLEVRRGETLVSLGGSGSGKSTLLRTMIGALEPTGGRVLLFGEDLHQASEAEVDHLRRRFGILFQSGAL